MLSVPYGRLMRHASGARHPAASVSQSVVVQRVRVPLPCTCSRFGRRMQFWSVRKFIERLQRVLRATEPPPSAA